MPSMLFNTDSLASEAREERLAPEKSTLAICKGFIEIFYFRKSLVNPANLRNSGHKTAENANVMQYSFNTSQTNNEACLLPQC